MTSPTIWTSIRYLARWTISIGSGPGRANQQEITVYAQALDIARRLKEGTDFTVQKRRTQPAHGSLVAPFILSFRQV